MLPLRSPFKRTCCREHSCLTSPAAVPSDPLWCSSVDHVLPGLLPDNDRAQITEIPEVHHFCSVWDSSNRQLLHGDFTSLTETVSEQPYSWPGKEAIEEDPILTGMCGMDSLWNIVAAQLLQI